MTSKILVMSASLRSGSFNSILATLAGNQLKRQGAIVTEVNLREYALPIFDAAIEAQGIPSAALALHEQFCGHDGIFIASPEYNAFPPPLLLNVLDWLSRVRHNEGGTAEAFERPAFALGSASPSPMGGYRGLVALRHKLELGLGANVLADMVAVPAAYDAFEADGSFKSGANHDKLTRVMARLLAATL